jgi:hypothetical protein
VIDERLEGSDLEWAREHLRRCDACRGRLTDFTDMALRVERLPMASVTSEAITEALAWITGRPIAEDAWQMDEEEAFEAPPMPLAGLVVAPEPLAAAVEDLPAARAIFEEEAPASFDRPDPAAALFEDAPRGEAVFEDPDEEAGLLEAPDEEARWFESPEEEADLPLLADPPELSSPPAAIPAFTPPPSVVQLTSHPPTQPVASHLLSDLEREIFKDSPWEFAGLPPLPEAPARSPTPAARIAPAPERTATRAEPTHKESGSGSDTLMRIVVGLGTAGCILLAAFLYDGDWLHLRQQAAVSPAPSATLRPTPTPTPTVAATPSAIPTPTPLALMPAPVVARLGNGLRGESVIRIRPGTAYATYTRLVFDLQGSGLPTMVITRPDPLHLVVRFKSATAGSQLAVGGIHSAQVARIETPLEDGGDLLITIDLARPVRLVPFTLPASGGYHPRLVLDLYRS